MGARPLLPIKIRELEDAEEAPDVWCMWLP
jgi:hypothetical protein